ncbi:deoxyxylulose-5-phosphate synthase [Chloroherpeton thalassium ATCC 35110]|uniref:1-deoxy-D-xylulose-5-phosphate synthase n=1 Tax=Chloroherpeton thalassium (strain ATCC 35110 / GB-78) TaxID=517418 RepID=B3QT02_CHLT3|nr:1-deoxy-D-xylulose-5-phosphate synthase [Chloroherpeton thalassium]ACF12645.1 deoxyxylulose-5-phosphate synthase [Chloroherpeton thalassium ATCC 35110]
MNPNLKESEELASFGTYLSKIDSPEDLRKFSIEELPAIAQECRELVIDAVSKNGGHFGSSLGVAELSVALHYAYNTPKDQIIWDVGHQAYVHKILTGRKNFFYSNRKYGGVSGFPKRAESCYDAFGVGHASTSISAATGMAAARDLAHEDFKVVAVIGDGSMTGGMAFEGMNHLGHLKTDVTVILNDNRMSIDPNVGGLREYLTDITTNFTYNKIRRDIWQTLSKFDNEIGSTARRLVRGIEDGLKAALTPGSYFEALGFRYFGPIDGHDVGHLARVLTEIRGLPHPKLLHIVTVKGKGFAPAEANQSKWHAQSGAFDKVTGVSLKKADPNAAPKYQDVFGDAITKIAGKDQRVVGVTAAMPSGTSLKKLGEKYPERFFDVGIAEPHAVTFAAGMAVHGFKPVCAIYSTFLQRAYDQIIHDVALQKLNVIFAIDRAGLVGADGPTHHGVFDLSFLRMIPNMVVMAPMHEQELCDMLLTAVKYENGPVAVRYPRGNGLGMALQEFKQLPIGKGEVLRDGEEIAILGIGLMSNVALEAAALLEAQGVSPLVANMRFVKPIDTELLDAICARFDRIVTIEENTVIGGFGSAVCEYLQEKGHRNRVLTLGIPDRFIEHGSVADLHREIGLDAQGVVKRILEFAHSEDIVAM